MARAGNRRDAPDLTATIELLAVRIGDQIGSRIARVLAESEAAAKRGKGRARTGPALCAKEGCGRAVAAKGLCKSHYNLMLYHRRKAETARPAARKTARRQRRKR